MKKLLILLTILFAIQAYASDTPQLDAFLKHKSFSADFTQLNQYPGLDNFTYTGHAYIVRPKEALWDYENPREYYLMRPDGIEHYSESLKQILRVKVDVANSNDTTALLLSIFLDGSNVKKHFTVKENTVDKLTTISLSPVKKGTVGDIELQIQGGLIKSVASKDATGSAIKIEFTNVQQGKKIDAKVFTPAVPADTQIIDQ
ncbi:MAG: outer-membrane lipoprotein carrier protein LolA [Deferribacteraceae bacterium]|jgi:outer membrane lipoprotein-sorting protein|nr:outer-membrane lipoprotein carrier protein LolA [Deferribacteraceae bacterium]